MAVFNLFGTDLELGIIVGLIIVLAIVGLIVYGVSRVAVV